MRFGRLACVVVMAGAVAAGPVESGFTQTATYAAVDAAGPTLSVAPALLDESLSCTPGLAGSGRAPVLLVPGTNVTPEEHFSWNYMRAFDDLGWPYCTVATPKHATEDLQISAEYVVHAIRTMHGRSGRRIAILGGSQGGMLPRWALRFWPDTRALVDDLVGLAATNHGGQGIAPLCVPDCAPALWQQLYGSEFMRALNSGQETFPGISYTAVYSHQDGLANPAADDTGTSSLHGGGGRITNVAVEDICPVHVADHIKMASYDAAGYALTLDALTHDGPADPARVDTTVCTREFPPGVDPVTFPATYAEGHAAIAYQLATAARVDSEPALRCYVTAGC